MNNYDELMKKARATNRKRDQMDKEAGFAAPDQGPLSAQIGTIMSAIEAGIKTDDWDCVAEGQAMLEVMRRKVRMWEQRTQ